MSINRRIRKLEDPRSPRERGKGRGAARTCQEIEERERRWFEDIAAKHPERVDDYLEALEELHPALEDLPEEASREEVRDATDVYLEARQRFEHGYVSGTCCEDCGRAAVHYKETGPEGTCQHCGGVTSGYGYWLKRVIPLEKLEAEIAATQRLGYPERAERLAALMERRLMEKTNTKGDPNGRSPASIEE